MYELLDSIQSPADIKGYTIPQLRQLCAELRSYIIECCSENPGHLASSLGAIETIVACHYVFDTPSDKLVFDVGHQAYAHKILTGRREAFRTLRTGGGISGFPKRSESEYDAFGVGHSSTSISAALGLAEAARMQGRKERAIAIIGDGALTGGLAFEGLNNAATSDSNLLIIVNDNNQSIDPAHGGLHDHLLRITTSRGYNRLKNEVWRALGQTRFRNFIQRWLRSLKSWFVKSTGGDVFEALGLRYFGPVDGNDIELMVKTLRKLKSIEGPRLLHSITVKGKGYEPAEADPVVWHAPGKFNPQTGERIKTAYVCDRYQDVFGEVLCELAERDPRVVGITPAMASGCGMNLLAERMPERFFDVGIEEEHAVTFSAGLAAGGMRPFCNIYSSFSQRAYDQIVHDVALQDLPVVLCFDRAGLVGEDGATHNGAFDLAAYRSIPNAIVSAPRNEAELKYLMFTALGCDHGPFIIRYPRGLGEGVDWNSAPYKALPIGKSEKLLSGSDIAIVAIGPVVNRALEAAEGFEGRVSVYDFKFLKPLDTEALSAIARSHRAIITLEDGCLAGGLYGAVCEHLHAPDPTGAAGVGAVGAGAAGVGAVGAGAAGIPVRCAGIPDKFIVHDRQATQRKACGLDAESIAQTIRELLG